MKNTGKIKSIERAEWGRYAHGTNFSKGQFIATIVEFFVHVIGEASFKVDRGTLLKQDPGRQRITQSYLDSFKGKDASQLRGK